MTQALDGMVRLASSEEVKEGDRLILDVQSKVIGLFRSGGSVYAYLNSCPHQGGPACQGRIVPRVETIIDEGGKTHGSRWDESDMRVVCPWHGLEFRISTGEHATIPSYKLRSFLVIESEGAIYCRIDDEA